MFDLDLDNPVLNEVIAEGARSAESLQEIRDKAIAAKQEEAEARRPHNEKIYASLAQTGERLRTAQRQMSAAVSPSTTNNSANKVLLDLDNGAAPTRQQVKDYNSALENAHTVEIKVDNNSPRQLPASEAGGSYGSSYSTIAGHDTDLVYRLTVRVVK